LERELTLIFFAAIFGIPFILLVMRVILRGFALVFYFIFYCLLFKLLVNGTSWEKYPSWKAALLAVVLKK
jgi:hypothetical protein